jgi:hypothetical protein
LQCIFQGLPFAAGDDIASRPSIIRKRKGASMSETMQLTLGFENAPRQLLIRLADVDLPRRFVVACARKREFYVGDLVQMSRWQVRERCGRSEADLVSVEAFMGRSGFKFETTVERWTPDGAAMMEGLVFGIAKPSPKILAIPTERLGLGTRDEMLPVRPAHGRSLRERDG